MELKKSVANKIWGLVLMLCMSRVCHGQLMCYVCDNCDQITSDTPQFECNEDFFNTGGLTGSSVQTTTELTNTTTSTIEDNTTTPSDETTLTPTTVNTEETTIRMTTTTKESKSTESTTKAFAENATVIEYTTETSPETTGVQVTESAQDTRTTTAPKTGTITLISYNASTIKPLDDVETLNNQSVTHGQPVNKDEVEDIESEQNTTKTYKPSAEFRVRQLRSISDVTFHCFKVQATTSNGTMVVNRGCSRIQSNESVCDQWKSQHSNEKMSKCYPCSLTKCNGSSALNVSVATLLAAVVAVFMHRN